MFSYISDLVSLSVLKILWSLLAYTSINTREHKRTLFALCFISSSSNPYFSVENQSPSKQLVSLVYFLPI